MSEFSTTLPLVDGAPSVGSGGLALQSNHVHPTEGVARAIYYATGTGGVAPTKLSRTPNGTADSFAHAVTSSWTYMFYDYDDTTAKAGIAIWPAGTYKIRMWLASANADGHTSVYPALAVGYSYALCSGGSVVVTSASLAAYDSYCTLTADKILAPSDYLGISMRAQTASSDTLTVGLGGLASTSVSVPWSPQGIGNIAGGVGGNVSQVPCVGTSTSITTATGTSTDISLCTIPIASTSAPGLLQISTATPLGNAASGSAGNGLQVSAWNHVHPISSSGLIYYATSGGGFSTTLPVTPTELTQAMSGGSATVTLATSSGTPGLSVWPAGSLNFDVWAYMANPGSGCTYTLEATDPPTTVAAIRSTSTPYQTGASTAGVALTGSYAEYQFTIPVSQLTGTSTDIFQTPLKVTSTNSPTCNAATLHIGVGTGQATNIGTLFYQVPSLDGVEYQANKNAANGYCPLDSSTLVPVANLPAGTTSVAGTMSAADKTKLDGIAAGATPDSYEVAAAYGTTPGYLAAVCESADSSITIGQTGDYVTFAANFGDGTAQVCSGATCAGLQSQLPACVPGQVEQFGTVTATGTATSTTTTRTCQNSPWQVAGSYQPTLPGGTNGQVLAMSATGTGTSTNWQPATLPLATTPTASYVPKADTASKLDARWIVGGAPYAGQIVMVGTDTSVGIVSGTSTSTSASLSAVTFPTGTRNQYLGISSAVGTGTATVTMYAMKTIPIADVDQLTNTLAGKQASLGTSTQGAVLYNGSTSTGTNTSSIPVWGPQPASVAIDTATPTNVTAGAGSAGSNGKASDSGHIHHIGANTPTHGQWLVAGTDTTTTTNTTNAVNWAFLPASSGSVAGVCAYGYTSGKCVQGDDYRLGNYGIRDFHSAQLSGLVTVSSNTWTSVLSVSTSGSAGRIIAYGAITLTSNSASRCDARIVLDNYAGGDGPALKGVTDSNVQASLSPIYTTTFAAGAHTVNLQVLNFSSINCQATVGYQSESFGSLIVQEFTN